ncbi:RNA-guided pseudouridylation complex pseudouridine synthase subunit Cbf5, partial [Candidatus Micrarchaeota archaeon]|nr:RNA-guided pseudouridylation complex pseudouridine synthase subunit Cbf5 [Candidatus Micrarchaeota archaeon]
KRSGRAGTLDPQVSGVLPVALGRATKLLGYIAGKTKTYVGIIKFRDEKITDGRVRELFREFTGEITQTPPRISAVRKVARKRHVYHIKFLERKGRLVLFEAKVDAGTYIRTLCEDIGRKCGGARMEELRRTAVGRIGVKETVTMQDLIDAMWLWKEKKDGSELLKMLKRPEDYIEAKRVTVKENAVSSLLSGAQLMAPGLKDADGKIAKDEIIALYSESGKFVGMGKALFDAKGMKEMKQGQVVKIERIQLRPSKE